MPVVYVVWNYYPRFAHALSPLIAPQRNKCACTFNGQNFRKRKYISFEHNRRGKEKSKPLLAFCAT